MEKVYLTTNGSQLHIEMPIAKVDKETRVVSGFATLDNPDTQGDIVTPEASEQAFQRWRKNIREMHGNVAVGKALSFEPKTYYDPETKREYNGMYVNAYISKGAQDTWEKVLDGTLSGFSIGGSINKSESVVDKAAGSSKRYRRITDYNLTELSLVDNPANQLASIVSFQKMSDGSTEADGILTKMATENIFYCDTDNLAVTSEDEAKECHVCKNSMLNIGWVEQNDPEKDVVIDRAIDKMNTSEDTDMLLKELDVKINSRDNIKVNELLKSLIKALDEGGAPVTEENKDGATETQPVPDHAVATGPTNVPDGDKIEEVETVADPNATATEPVEEVSEVEGGDLSKLFSDLKESLSSAIADAKNDTNKVVSEVKEEISKTVSGVEEKFEEFKKEFEGLKATVNEHGEKLSGVSKRVEDVEGSAAIKKSGDLVGDDPDDSKIKKSVWGGSLLGPGYLSASNLEQ